MGTEEGTDATDTGAGNSIEGSDTSTEGKEVNSDAPGTEAGAETGGEKSGTSQENSELSGDEGETGGESDTSEGEAGKGKQAKKRIDKLTREKGNLQLELDRLKAEKEQPAPVLEPTAEPKEEDFEDYADYQKAHTSWMVKEAVAANDLSRSEEGQRQSSEKQAYERSMDFDRRADVFRETHEDFDAVAKSPEMMRFYTDYAPHLAEAIESNEKGPEIAYHLGENPDVAIKLARMSPIQAAVEVGKLEAKLSTDPKPKAVSKAPDPINPVGGGQGVVDKDPTEMNDDEFATWRKSHIAKRNQ